MLCRQERAGDGECEWEEEARRDLVAVVESAAQIIFTLSDHCCQHTLKTPTPALPSVPLLSHGFLMQFL